MNFPLSDLIWKDLDVYSAKLRFLAVTILGWLDAIKCEMMAHHSACLELEISWASKFAIRSLYIWNDFTFLWLIRLMFFLKIHCHIILMPSIVKLARAKFFRLDLTLHSYRSPPWREKEPRWGQGDYRNLFSCKSPMMHGKSSAHSPYLHLMF